MNTHTLAIEAKPQPELLERVLRVTRHRGFVVKQCVMANTEETSGITIEVTVESDRPITNLYHQLDKLWDVTNIKLVANQQQLRA